MRDRLIEFLCAVACKGDDRREGGCGFRQNDRCNRIEKLDMCMIECIADHLLANGVIVPCRCENCKFWASGVCHHPEQRYLFTEKTHYCGYAERSNENAE